MAKRANGEGTLRKRSDGRWEARYVSPVDNKQHSIYGKTQKAVREKLQKILQEFSEYAELQGEDMSISAWLDIWLKNYTSNVKQSTLSTYRSAIETRIKPYIGEKSLKTLTTSDIQDIYTTLNKEGLSPKTVKNTHGVIHKSLAQAIKLRYIKYNVSEGCVIPKIERTDIRPLDEKDIVRFLKEIKGDKYEAIYFVTLFTGMRQGEVLGLTWDCIDFENNLIYLNKQLVKLRDRPKSYRFGSLKNGKSRTIYMSNSVADVLRKHQIAQDIARRNAGEAWIGDKTQWKDLVFTNETGECIANYFVYKRYKAIVERIGLGYSRFHDLRHSFAVISLQNGDDIKTVQDALGHHTSAFTLQVYAHSTQKMKQDSAQRMDAFIQQINHNNES